MIEDFLPDTMQAKRQCSNIFKVVDEKLADIFQ